MDEQQLVEKLQGGGKYAAIEEGVLRRVIRRMMPRYAKERDVLDAVKRHLHIICGMYVSPPELRGAAQALRDALPQEATPGRVLETANALMARHASTRERLDSMEAFYAACFAPLPPVRFVVDLGCGFQPFARPLMPIGAGCEYAAYDLMPQVAEMIDAFFAWAGLTGRAGVMDLTRELPQRADVALMMKLLPVLEQQERGAAVRLLEGLPCAWAVATFPTRSVGGRQRGMAAHYEAWMRDNLPARWAVTDSRAIGNELLYVLQSKEEPT